MTGGHAGDHRPDRASDEGGGNAERGIGNKAVTDVGDGEEPSGTAAHTASASTVFYCDLCGSVMLNLHCKLICERCGYKRDCSDP